MPFEVRATPPWSWSVSRRGCFRECARRYYFHYYGYHNGWLEGARDEARRAYRLRNLKSLPILVGEVLHGLFAEALRDLRAGAAAPGFDAMLLEARHRMNRGFGESKNRRAWEAQPKRLVMLRELYQGPEPSDADFERIRARLRAAIRGFLDSRSFREAASAPLAELKSVDHEGHFELDDTRVYAAPDLAYRRGDGTWTIVDWKTGGEDGAHAVQLGVYALYLRHRHGVAGPIVGRLEYVGEGRGEDVPLEPAVLDAAEREIRDSVAAMRGYLVDSTTNEARAREAFPLREDRAACPQCNFFELCKPELEATTPTGPF